MHRFFTLSPYASLCALVASALSMNLAIAQDSNILGLPAIPQPKPGAAAPAAKPASGAKPAAESPSDRDAIAGEMGIQHSALDGLGRLVFTSKNLYQTEDSKKRGMAAARAVQRDLALACGKQCKPDKMGAPRILGTGQLEFDLSFRPLYQHLNQAQFLAALQSKPLNLTPAQLAAPAPIAPPSVSIVQSNSQSSGTAAK